MIYTVTGPIVKDQLGLTLSHEHLFPDSNPINSKMMEEDFHKLYPVFTNLAELGCRSIVEVSGLGDIHHLRLMHQLSLETGINILLSTGLHFSDYDHYAKMNHDSFIDELSNLWISHFTNGIHIIENVPIHPSHIKLFIGNEKLTNFEKKLLKAAIITSKRTGMRIHCHILYEEIAREVFDLLDENQFDYSNFLWAHSGYDNQFKLMKEVVKKGMWLGFDIIQEKNYEKYYQMIKEALIEGYSDKILLSQDYDFLDNIDKQPEKHLCNSLFTHFIPFCMNKGLKKEAIDKILTDNPSIYYNIE